MATFNIPQTNLKVGSNVHGPFAIPVGATSAVISINRNVGATPIDSFPETQLVFTLVIESSLDGGATWQEEGRADFNGGVILKRDGTELTANALAIAPLFGDPASTTRSARATTIATARCSVSGSVTLS